VEASSFFRWRCGVCGGPVVPDGTGELASLVRAHRSRAMAVGWFAAAIVFGCIAALAGSVAFLLWAAARGAAAVVGAVAVVAALVAGTGRARGVRHNAEARKELSVAWGQGART
jgi:hypothetical protein